MLARDKGDFHALGKNRTRDPPVQWLERSINMQYSEGREFNSCRGTKIFVVPGEYDFSSFQVENVHWKCMCVAHQCIVKINKNKNKINLRNYEFVRKKQNGG